MVIGGELHTWEQGKVVGIDDSIVHSMRHRGTLSQTVLIIDVLHPNHPGTLSLSLSLSLSDHLPASPPEDPSEVLRDTTTFEELDAIEQRQQDLAEFFG